MALKLNSFRTYTGVVSATPTAIYTAPVGYTGVVILSQVANISSSTSHDVTLIHRRGATDTELFKSFPIQYNDTANLLNGKLVLEPGDKLVISGSNSSDLKYTISVLENLN